MPRECRPWPSAPPGRTRNLGTQARLINSIGRITLFVIMLLGLAGSSLAAGPGPAVAKEAGAPSGRLEVRAQGGRLSVEAEDADIVRVLKETAARAGVALTVAEGISGRISLRLTEVTFPEALRALCQNQALVYESLPGKNAYRVVQALVLPATAAGKGEDIAEQEKTSGQTPARAGGNPNGAPPDIRPGGSDALGSVSPPRLDPQGRPLYRARELLVTYDEGASAEAIAALHRLLGSVVIRDLPRLRLQRILLKEGLAEAEGRARYLSSPLVRQADLNALRYPLGMPNDPSFSRQWALNAISAPSAWDLTQGSPEVIVAVIDTGIDYTHPDLAPNIWVNEAELNGLPNEDDDGNGYVDDIRGWDFAGSSLSSAGDSDPMDLYNHGTHVAGIVAARGNNGLGISGVNWLARLMPLKVQVDSDQEFDSMAIIEAIHYAIAMKARIVICSFGGGERNLEEEQAFAALKQAGILAVCAAGNSSLNTDLHPHYPSGYPFDNILSIGASDSYGNRWSSSNYGAATVDLLAPGVSVYSTVPVSTGTEALVRTSGASPLVLAAVGMEYAATTGPEGITGAVYDCGQGYPEQFPAGLSGYLALIQRGNRDGTDFYFYEKMQNAQNAGAAGIVFYNNVVDAVDAEGGTLNSTGSWATAVFLSLAHGEALLALLQSGATPITLINVPASYGIKSGTSMAAPHVAGAAGLILARCPSLGYAELRSAILGSVDKANTAVPETVSGGRLNAFAALAGIVRGDLSGDCRAGLEDALLALQILAGLRLATPYPCPACGSDLEGNGMPGLAEALFSLQKAAGLR